MGILWILLRFYVYCLLSCSKIGHTILNYITSQLCHSLVVQPLRREILDRPERRCAIFHPWPPHPLLSLHISAPLYCGHIWESNSGPLVQKAAHYPTGLRPSSFFYPFTVVRPTQIFGIFKKNKK